MNNNINFDPMTGKPLQNNTHSNTTIQQVNGEQISPQPNNINVQQIYPHQEIQTNVQQVNLQNVPTVEQNKQDFINNVQLMNQEKKEEKKEGINFVFIIVLFVVILISIYFLFPLLLDLI